METNLISNSTKTRNDILHSAKEEFLKNGFSRGSLRTIASNAGVTTGALYRHFKDKNSLFEAIVSPVYNGFFQKYQDACSIFFEKLKTDGLDPMWKKETNATEEVIGYLYENLEIFRLLITGAEYSTYENFTHSIIDLEVKMTKKYLELSKEYGYTHRGISDTELHIFVNSQFSCIFEMILHNIPKKEALNLSKDIVKFFRAGWYALLME